MMTEQVPREVGPAAHQEASRGDGHLAEGDQDPRGRGMRRWAWAGLIAQIAFVISWVTAATWQGPRYSTVTHSISDMYAETAPGAAFLIIMLTLCGAATAMFAVRSVRRALRSGGWTATFGSVLLALSIFGLGDLLTVTERLACRMADPGCTATRQIANTGGQLDSTLSTYGVLALIVADVFLSFAMRQAATWRGWAWPTRWTMLVLFCAAFADAIGSHYGLGGFFERLIALIGAAWIAAVAVGILRRNRKAPEAGPAGSAAGPGMASVTWCQGPEARRRRICVHRDRRPEVARLRQ